MRRMYNQLELANVIKTNVPQIIYNEYGFYVEEGVLRCGKDFSFDLDLRVNGDIECDGDVNANTLKQTHANWEQSISTIIFGGLNANLVVEIGYSAFKVVNASLKFIIEFKISNPTESSINVLSANTSSLPDLPDDITSKLYLVNGSSLKDNTGTDVLLTQFPILIATNGSLSTTPQIGSAVLYATNNKLKFGFRFYNNQGIASNQYASLSSRVELDLV